MHDLSKWVDLAGATVWYASWHAAVLAGVLLVIMRALQRVVPAGPRSLLWLVIFARLAMPAAPASCLSLDAAFGRWNSVDVSRLPGIGAADRRVSETAGRSPALRQSPRLDRLKVEAPRRSVSGTSDSLDVTHWLWRLCLIVWLAGVAALSIRCGCASIRLRRLIGRCERVEETHVRQLAEECRRQCGLIFTPVIRRAPAGLGAALVGLIRPVLLVSDRTLCRDPAELRLILLHEMRHARVGDCWFAWWIRLLSTIHWFNPFVWLSARAWQAERELACDAWVLKQAGATERLRYGRTLLAVLEETSGTNTTLLSIAMASPANLIERRLRQVNRPTADSNWRRALAVVLAAILAATGLTDSVRSQPRDSNLSPRNANSTGSAKTSREEEPKSFTVVVAEHAFLVQGKIAQNTVLTDWKLVTWQELQSVLRERAKVRPITIEVLFTNGSAHQFDDLQKRFFEFHKEFGARVILSFAGPNASKRYDAIRGADDLKTDRLGRRDGTLLLADGRPAAGATVLLREKSQFPCCIYLDNGNLRDPADEVWAKTDEQGHFTLFSKDDHFAVAALHPSGFAVATGKELENGRALTLQPWARINLKAYAEVGLAASQSADGKDAIHMDFQVFSGTRRGIQIPPGRVSLQRFLKHQFFDSRTIEVAPAETKEVDVQPPPPKPAAKTTETRKQS
ncbi:MAG TPA: M56 family metallopeptidase [Planctomycetaceae bacterium]|nr:M56 family metallopeptidase [Planctomycetaceae bacterium]